MCVCVYVCVCVCVLQAVEWCNPSTSFYALHSCSLSSLPRWAGLMSEVCVCGGGGGYVSVFACVCGCVCRCACLSVCVCVCWGGGGGSGVQGFNFSLPVGVSRFWAGMAHASCVFVPVVVVICKHMYVSTVSCHCSGFGHVTTICLPIFSFILSFLFLLRAFFSP